MKAFACDICKQVVVGHVTPHYIVCLDENQDVKKTLEICVACDNAVHNYITTMTKK